MTRPHNIPLAAIPLAAVLSAVLFAAQAAEPRAVMKTETFDRDPGWDRSNNRPADRKDEPVEVRQDFGFSPTSHAGGKPGEAGGRVQAAAEAAYYAQVIREIKLQGPLRASGTLAVADGGTHLLLGFFNAGAVNEWRTPNTVSIRINGRGDHFFAYVEYCTSKWRAGGDSPKSFPFKEDPQTKRRTPLGFASGRKPHRWSLTYDPAGNGGAGAVTATVDDKTAVCHLDPGHKSDGATFNRFGLLNVMKSADDATEVYLDNATVNGETETFDADPKWDARGNRRTYRTHNVRPRFDFGYSPTRFAGGTRDGEIGGLFFRGDCRYPERMAYYGDRIGPLSLDKPMKASGKVVMTRGVTDSTTMFGFFNARDSMRSNPSQSDAIPEAVLGFNIEGPSSEGFLFYPVFRAAGGNGTYGRDPQTPHVYPDGVVRQWALDYDPAGAGGRGRVTVSLGDRRVHLDLNEGDKARGTRLDRFGFITPWIDGNGQTVYFDDLTYTLRQ
jgi:hypothetical protein